jgi:hypothetical protein
MSTISNIHNLTGIEKAEVKLFLGLELYRLFEILSVKYTSRQAYLNGDLSLYIIGFRVRVMPRCTDANIITPFN